MESLQNKMILLSSKINSSNDELKEINDIIEQEEDWKKFCDTLIQRGVGPLFYSKIPFLPNSSVLPAEVKEKLRQSYYHTFSRGVALQEIFKQVAEAFSAAGIKVVALKGIHLAEWLYGDIGLRQLSDIDLLVSKNDGERCIQILTDLGFVQSGEEISHKISEQIGLIHYPAMILNQVSVEIHVNLFRKNEPYTINIEELIHRAQPVVINQTSVYALEIHDLLIYLCIHLDKHFKGGDIQFTSFCDIVNLLDIHSKEINWQELEQRCKAYNCEKTVFKYIILCRKYFKVEIPVDIVDKFSMYLSLNDEKLFKLYLSGYKSAPFGAGTHIRNVSEIVGLREKLRYLRMVIFPSKEFMQQNYPIKYPSVFWLYYPIRHWKGMKGVLKR